jgi:hypothetical protein
MPPITWRDGGRAAVPRCSLCEKGHSAAVNELSRLRHRAVAEPRADLHKPNRTTIASQACSSPLPVLWGGAGGGALCEGAREREGFPEAEPAPLHSPPRKTGRGICLAAAAPGKPCAPQPLRSRADRFSGERGRPYAARERRSTWSTSSSNRTTVNGASASATLTLAPFSERSIIEHRDKKQP